MAKKKLTNQFCREVLHTGTHNIVNYFDIELKGFMLEVRKTGGKTFYLRYQHNRKTRSHKIGDAKAMSAAIARKEAKRVKSEINLGKDLHADKTVRRNTPTLNEFYAEHYLPYVKQRKRSWVTDKSIFENHILPALGKQQMSDITKYMVMKLHSSQVEKGFKAGSANKLPIFISAAFNLAIKWDITGVTKNPAAKFELLPENNKIERYLTQDEAARLLTSVSDSENKLLKYIVLFLLLTGARRNECLQAKWEHFDYKAMTWTIPLSKSGKPHHVPITSELLNLLETIPRRNNSQYVFENVKTGKAYTNTYTAWNTARKKAGLADVRLHDLRHTFASTLVNSGRSLYEVQSLLGHSNIAVTQRYAHLSNDSLMEAANCAATLLPKANRRQLPVIPTAQVIPTQPIQFEKVNTLPV